MKFWFFLFHGAIEKRKVAEGGQLKEKRYHKGAIKLRGLVRQNWITKFYIDKRADKGARGNDNRKPKGIHT